MPGRTRHLRALTLVLAMTVGTACTTAADPSPASPADSVRAGEPAESPSPPDASQEPWTPPVHAIGIDGGRFVELASGETFTPRGVNYFLIVRTPAGGLQDRFFSPSVFDRDRLAADFARLAAAGYNTVRLFLDSCNAGPDCIGDTEGDGLDGDYLDNIAETMALARDAGLVLLLTSNDLPDDGGYWQIADQGNSETFPGYRNTAYLTEAGHRASVAYWSDLLDGLVERRAAFDAVLGVVDPQRAVAVWRPTAALAGRGLGQHRHGDVRRRR